MCQRQIDATDAQIDALVYALYGLTEEEIRDKAERLALGLQNAATESRFVSGTEVNKRDE
jgi:hypothetical protein